jgi:hypothetical protein
LRCREAILWLVLLAVTGFCAYLFTRYLLGVQALVEESAQDAGPRPGRLFVATSLAALAIAGLWAAQGPRIGLTGLGHSAVLLAQTANPCGATSGQARALQTHARQQLDEASGQAVDGAMRSVDSGLELAFGATEAGIDKYLDWYFCFIGSYTRMGALVIPDLTQHMRGRFSDLVFKQSGFEKQLESLGNEAEAAMLDRFVAEVEAIGLGIAQQLKLRPCLIDTLRPIALPGLERDVMRVALSTAVALPLSRAVGALALRSGAAVMARAAARPTVRAAASAAGAMSSKRGASVLLSAGAAAAVCARRAAGAGLCCRGYRGHVVGCGHGDDCHRRSAVPQEDAQRAGRRTARPAPAAARRVEIATGAGGGRLSLTNRATQRQDLRAREGRVSAARFAQRCRAATVSQRRTRCQKDSMPQSFEHLMPACS